jgi:hypothetical protein
MGHRAAMVLDCTTPRGIAFIGDQTRAAIRLAAHCKCEMIETKHDGAADIDALFYRDKILTQLVEVKARGMDYPELKGYGSYMITHDKIVRGAELARSHATPYGLLILLKKDEKLIFWKIADYTGRLICPFRVEVTETQATCNGGKAARANAFLPLSEGRFIP